MKWELYIRDEWMREIWKVLTVIEKWLKGWWFSRKCAGIESNWKFGIDWEKREFGSHRGKDGERAGKRQRKRGRLWNKVESKEERGEDGDIWVYVGGREKIKRKTKEKTYVGKKEEIT